MRLNLQINGTQHEIETPPGESLLAALRRLGYFDVKHGCESGDCGVCAVLLDGRLVNTCVHLAAQAEGHPIQTVASLGQHPERGWKHTSGLHPIQAAFVESGAIQCGYCTPAQVLAATQLLDANPNPTEQDVRDALSGVLCRCTGYLKPVQAVLRAAALLRGESVDPIAGPIPAPPDWLPETNEGPAPAGPAAAPALSPTQTQVMPRIQVTSETETWQRVGKPEPKVDAVKLVQGKPAFAADFEKRDMLVAKVLHSPHAHARIKNIDVGQALELAGVAAVLTWKDIPRVIY